MYMDKDEIKLKNLIQTVIIYNQVLVMEFGI